MSSSTYTKGRDREYHWRTREVSGGVDGWGRCGGGIDTTSKKGSLTRRTSGLKRTSGTGTSWKIHQKYPSVMSSRYKRKDTRGLWVRSQSFQNQGFIMMGERRISETPSLVQENGTIGRPYKVSCRVSQVNVSYPLFRVR